MKLYDYFRSTAAYRVRIALNIKHINYEKIPINLLEETQHTSRYAELNPQGLVPTLDENGHILTQSLAIIEYLDEINPEPPLLPPNPLGPPTAIPQKQTNLIKSKKKYSSKS